MFCAPIKFLQYFGNIKPVGCFGPLTDVTGGKQPPCLRFLNYCQNFITAQNISESLSTIAY